VTTRKVVSVASTSQLWEGFVQQARLKSAVKKITEDNGKIYKIQQAL